MARFRPRQRLRTRAQFDRVFRHGVRADGRLFLLIAAANGRGEDRLGLTVSRRVGEAVARNRVRRWLRESFRVLEQGKRPGVDLVVLAKKEIAASGLREVERELRERLRRLERSDRLAGSSPAPAR
jgi:ribonuclease P protein component